MWSRNNSSLEAKTVKREALFSLCHSELFLLASQFDSSRSIYLFKSRMRLIMWTTYSDLWVCQLGLLETISSCTLGCMFYSNERHAQNSCLFTITKLMRTFNFVYVFRVLALFWFFIINLLTSLILGAMISYVKSYYCTTAKETSKLAGNS